MDPLYTLQLIHPHKSDVHQIADSDELALLLNHAIIELRSIKMYSYDANKGTYVYVIESYDPASPDKLTRYRVEGASLSVAMPAFKQIAPAIYNTLSMQ